MINNVKPEGSISMHLIPVIDNAKKALTYVEREATVVEFLALRRTNYIFHLVKKLRPHPVGHTCFIVHLETGYILASGATDKEAIKSGQTVISELTTLSDIGGRIIFQKKLNKSFSSISSI